MKLLGGGGGGGLYLVCGRPILALSSSLVPQAHKITKEQEQKIRLGMTSNKITLGVVGVGL